MLSTRKTLSTLGVALCAGLLTLSGSPVAQAAPSDPDSAPHARQVHSAVHGNAAHRRLHDAEAGFLALHRQLAGTHTATPADTIHPAQGTSLSNVSGVAGAAAEQSATTDLHPAASGTTIYTPTLYPPGGSCIEVTTVYTNSVQEVAAWDWCNAINFQASVPIDGSFMATYTSNGAYRVDIHQTDAASNTWAALLYNFQTSSWETLFTSSGSTQAGTTGWDVYELYSDIAGDGNSNACGDMSGKTFEANNIQVMIDGSWHAADDSNAGTAFDQPASAFHCPDMSYQMVNNYNHWKAVG